MHVAGGAVRQCAAAKINSSLLVFSAFAVVSGWFFSRYLNIAADHLAWLVLTVLEVMAFRSLCKSPLRGKMANTLIGFFSFLFAASLILGEHIVVADPYYGLSDVNYISAYSAADLFALLFIWAGSYALLAAPIAFARESRAPESAGVGAVTSPPPPVLSFGFRWVVGLTFLIFALWIPYLVVYWPGFVFPDCLVSIDQALGNAAWSNHHPVAYTAFLLACLKAVGLFGLGNTAGIGLSTVVQMLFMAFSFGYLARWIVVRGALKPVLGICISVALGMSSYFAAFSVALWKDPLFSSAGLLVSLCLADLAWSRSGNAACSKAWLILFTTGGLIMVFLRNNGVFALALVAVFVAIIAFKSRSFSAGKRESSGYLAAFASSILVLLVYLVVSGPIYSSMGIVKSEASEGVGVPLNQMARVAALGGEMTEGDREYLDSIIPFDEYPLHYYPCCTDNLKWSKDFSNQALVDGMWSHWLSMLLNNPRAYFEAWELQTFGFWTVNTEQAAGNTADGWVWNVSGGKPKNLNEAGVQALSDSYQINASDLSLNEVARSLFPVDTWSVPIGWLFWVACYLALLLLLCGRSRWVLGLIPSIGVALTLLLASPIWYWPRYGAVLQFCIPYYLLIAYLLFCPKRIRTFVGARVV